MNAKSLPRVVCCHNHKIPVVWVSTRLNAGWEACPQCGKSAYRFGARLRDDLNEDPWLKQVLDDAKAAKEKWPKWAQKDIPND